MKDEKVIEKKVHNYLVNYMEGNLSQSDIMKATGFSRSTVQKFINTGIENLKKVSKVQPGNPIVNEFVASYVKEPEMSLEVDFPAIEVVGRMEGNRIIIPSRMNYEKY